MTTYPSTDRFLRPADAGATRRHKRHDRAGLILKWSANGLLGILVLAAALWLYRETQSDPRFAVQQVEITGARHTSQQEIREVTRAFVGSNLFRLDLAGLSKRLQKLPWVQKVSVEKRLPGTLVLHVTERQPVALWRVRGRLRYVDSRGFAFAPLSPRHGNAELPLIESQNSSELERCVVFLDRVKKEEPAFYDKVSSVRSLPPNGFAIFDRDLGTFVVVGEDDWAERWKLLYAVSTTERYGRGALEYADVRFAKRIVLKPHGVRASSQLPGQPTQTGVIQPGN